MLNSENAANNWKNEQITVFKKYIKNFKPGSVEYMKLAQGIKDLERDGF
ncbi:MAG TPA: hypothetical protein PKG60_12260 [Spirochaetota bacterium]|nr:hypothetical protein [Spirochaetota bacterium]HPS85375.1 hypothetical protein [Spirochaetota bacterium]